MSVIVKAGKTAILGTLAMAFGVGAVAGVVAERALIGRAIRRGDNHAEPFGTLHSDGVEVIANDGLRIHAEVDEPIGVDDDITVIFAHGYALSMDEFHYQRRDLRHVARLAFYDQRSHGHSEIGTHETHHIDQLAADLDAVIDAVAPTGKVILVGHSMGGMTIQAFAGRRPDLFGTRIKAVVLACTSSGGMSEVPLGLPAFLGKLVMGIAPSITGALKCKQELVDRSREAGSDLNLLLTRRYSFASDIPSGMTEFVARMHSNTPIEVISDYLEAFSSFSSAEILPTFANVPTVIVAAGEDHMTPVEHSREIARLIPHAQYIEIPETGHMLPMERYNEFNEIISAVVEDVRRAG